jgi:PKD repeat protein
MAGTGHAAVVVTTSYSAFDTRSEFNGAGGIDHLNGFDEFTGGLVYEQPTPWTSNGVTYTSGLNIVLGPGVGLGVQSNSVSTEFGAALSATLGSDDAFTMFGADLTQIGAKGPVGLILSTNLGSYSFPNLDVPLATSGRRFFGIALSTPGEYLTGFRVTVGGGSTAILLDNVAVGHVAGRNADPDASAGGPYAGLEGSSVALNLSGTDADGDALTYSWDLGDGTTGSGTVPPSSHTYADNGAYAIVLAVSDGRGGVDTARATATISNVAPALAAFALPTTPLPLVSGGATLPISTSYTDPGTADTHTASLDCGTGFTAQSAAPNGIAGGTCTFSSPGVYTVRLTVIDDDGGSDTKLASGQVVVFDAAAGSLTGGGWVASPIGANAVAPSTSGKLTFWFVASYQPGATAPSGNAEFKLSAGKLDFRSTSLEWLVVGDANAQLQGRGTVNGAGDYAFSVIASDGSPGDAVRIRIWQRVTGMVVYDSRPAEPFNAEALTTLGGGSIQLHQR